MKSVIKCVLVLITVGLLGFALVSCSKASKETPQQTAETPASKTTSPETSLKFLTLPAGTGQYTTAVAINNLINQDTNVKMFLQTVASSLAIPKAIQSGEVEIGNNILPQAFWAYNGQNVFDNKHPDLRVLLTGEDMLWSYVTHGGTGVKTIADLKGKRVNWDFGVVSSLNTEVAKTILEVYGIDAAKDVKSVPTDSYNKPITDLVDRKSDAGFASVYGAKIAEFASQVKPVVLEIPPDKANAIHAKLPYIFPDVTRGDTEGIAKGIPVVSTPVITYTNKSLGDETAYLLVKTIIEKKSKLIEANQVFSQWKLVRPVGIPYHPGAVKYFKEAGLWTNEMEQEQQKLLK
jgi:TRAP transporter TAXI family solute receptor